MKKLKSEFRRHFLSLRQDITSEERIRLDQALCEQAAKLTFTGVELAHLFLPIEKFSEPNTFALKTYLDRHQPASPEWVLSRTDFTQSGMQELYHFIWDLRTPIRTNKWGIPEPLGGRQVMADQLDLIFVPLLAYDVRGNRVGYGKGFYDRFLSKCRPKALKVGLSWFEPVAEIMDIEPTDIRLDCCVTPKGIYHF